MSRLGVQRIRVLLSEEALRERVAALGAEITRDYAGKPLHLVGVLKGSFVFLADLMRAIDLPITVDFIGISSYVGTTTSGTVEITSDLTRSIEGRHVLLVEDVVDTGLTMQFLLERLGGRRPASIRICALLEKPVRARVKVPVAYRGFTIGDEFVVGYGLDRDGLLRNLPYVGAIHEE